MAKRLIALDKNPGVRPVGTGEVWQRAMAKAVLPVAGAEAKEACGTDQLCAGLEAGIEGAIHAMNLLWEQHEFEDDCSFLFVDASNRFNEENRALMLCNVRHLWPSGARFTFNSYKHWSIPIVRGHFGTTFTLFSKEGVTQGDPLGMAAHGLGLLPPVHKLNDIHQDAFTPWCADDSAAAGKFNILEEFFLTLRVEGPKHGCCPATDKKNILAVPERNLESARACFGDLGFTICSGSRCLGGFVGETDARDRWPAEKAESWTSVVQGLANVVIHHLQTAHAGLQKSLQHQWQHVQWVAKDCGKSFAEAESAIQRQFLPAPIGETLADDDLRLAPSALPIKFAGLSIPRPTESASQNYEASALTCSHVMDSLRGRSDFSSAVHKDTMREVKEEAANRKAKMHEEKLKTILRTLTDLKARAVKHGTSTGAWLSVCPSIINGTELSCLEFRDALHLRHGCTPPNLPEHCDGCACKFFIAHALQCKKGGPVISRHDDVRDDLGDLVGTAFKPSCVRDEPLINPIGHISGSPGSSNNSQGNTNSNMSKDDRGDLLSKGFWDKRTDTVMDVPTPDTDAKSHLSKTPEEVLEQHEREKKRKHLKPCLEQRCHFTPFVASCDGLFGKEAKAALRRISAKLAEKWQKPYSEVCGYVNARTSITLVRATHRCLRGSRIPSSQISSRRPQWEDGAGLSLYKH